VKIRNKKGFTLMEVLIVVAIIAVLVAIAIPVYNGLVEKARVAADAKVMRHAKTAFVIYELETGEKPIERAIYDIKSNTFITRNEFLAGNKFETYPYYGQAYNNNGGLSQSGSISEGINGHIYVSEEGIKESGEDNYGPEVLRWWADNKTEHPDRWGE